MLSYCMYIQHKARGLVRSARIGLNIFYLYTLYIEQHIKTYNNIQYKGAWTSDGTVLVKDGSDVVHRIMSGADLARFEDQRGVRD